MTEEEFEKLKIGDQVFVNYPEGTILQGKFCGDLGGVLLIGVMKDGKEAYQTNFPRFRVFKSEQEALRQAIKSYIDEKVSPLEEEAKAADERLKESLENLNRLQRRLLISLRLRDQQTKDNIEWMDATIDVLKKVPGGRFVREAANLIDVFNEWKRELTEGEKQDND